jgi:hypothetical protein
MAKSDLVTGFPPSVAKPIVLAKWQGYNPSIRLLESFNGNIDDILV